MSYRTDEIASTLLAFLDRYSPPRNIAADPRKVQEEREALVKVVVRRAPASYRDWLAAVLEDVERAMETRAWPSVADLHRACDRNKIAAASVVAMAVRDDYQITAERIQARDPIGEDYLYGPKAVELVGRGLATDAALDPYRSGVFWSHVEVYGYDRAQAMQAERRRFHGASVRPVSDEERQRLKADAQRARMSEMRRIPQVEP